MIIKVRSIMKTYRNFSRQPTFGIIYAMRSASIFPCIMTMISIFTMFFIFHIFMFKFFFTNITDFCIWYDCCCSFVNNFIFFILKLIIFIACFLKDLQSFLYTSFLFSMLLNDNIVDLEKSDGVCSLTSAIN